MRGVYEALYRLRVRPWDRADIPGPLARAAEARPNGRDRPGGSDRSDGRDRPDRRDRSDRRDGDRPARAVDLGCGTGTQARYLAQRGWAVTAVDFVSTAVAAARRDDPDQSVTWRVADVTDVSTVDPDGRLAGAVHLLLDNGCLHGLGVSQRPGWVHTVDVLAAPSALLLVRAVPRRRGPGPRGIDSADLDALLRPRWQAEDHPEPDWYAYRRGPA